MKTQTPRNVEGKLFDYVSNRLTQFMDSLSEEQKEMWFGEEAIYNFNRRALVEDAISEMDAEGITTITAARNFDLEALWE